MHDPRSTIEVMSQGTTHPYATGELPEYAGNDLPPPDDDDGGDENNGDGEPIDWVEVARFYEPQFAHIAKLKLESEGIRCFLDNENFVATDWLMANAVGGIKLRVPAGDYERALAIVRSPAEPVDDDIADDATDPSQDRYARSGERRCPKCGSGDVAADRSVFAALCGWLLLGVMIAPLVFFFFGLLSIAILFLMYVVWSATIITSRQWKCGHCNYSWQPGSPHQNPPANPRGFPVIPTSQTPAKPRETTD